MDSACLSMPAKSFGETHDSNPEQPDSQPSESPLQQAAEQHVNEILARREAARKSRAAALVLHPEPLTLRTQWMARAVPQLEVFMGLCRDLGQYTYGITVETLRTPAFLTADFYLRSPSCVPRF
jgi:hypothetical protein